MKIKTLITIIVLGASLIPHAMALGNKNYSRVINLSGKQRMLTQKASKEALLIALEIDKKANVENLRETRDLFDKTLKGLRNGDAELGLSPTLKPHLISCLDEVSDLWTAFDPALRNIVRNGKANDSQIRVIAATNQPLLASMSICVEKYELDASQEHLNEALAYAINLSGRQRMLTQKMTKEFLLIAKGHKVKENKEALNTTISLFDKTLDGLINGNTSQGLSPAPTEDIRTQLNTVKTTWNTLKPLIESEPTPENIQIIATQNLKLLNEMDHAVGMLEALGN